MKNVKFEIYYQIDNKASHYIDAYINRQCGYDSWVVVRREVKDPIWTMINVCIRDLITV